MLKSFQTKLAIFFMLLFAGVLGIASVTTQNAIVSNILEQSRVQLQASYEAFDRRFAATGNTLAEGSRILASDFGFRQAVATDDRPTILTALNNLGARIGADRVMLVSLEGGILADNGSAADAATTGNIVTLGAGDGTFPFLDMIDIADMEGEAIAIAVLDDRIYQTVVVPILAPVPIAWIVIVVEITSSFAQEMQWQSALPLEITFGFQDGADWRPGASTLSDRLRSELAGIIAARAGDNAAGPATLTMGRQEYATLVADLPVPEASRPISAVLQYSLDLALQPYRPLFALLVALTAGTLALSLVGAVIISRGVSKPIRTLDEAARRIQAGRYDEKIPISQNDEIGRLSETFNRMMDGIAEREEKIAHQARHDSSSGLPNRIAFEGFVSDMIIARQGTKAPFSVLLIQLGRFSEINNTLGHDTGELLIRMIGRSLQRVVTQPYAVARHANNMFAVALDQGDPVEVNGTVRRILALFENPVTIAGLNVDVTATIGEARYPEHGVSAKSLMQRADTAIYEAKKFGRSYTAYDPELDPYRPERLTMMGELRRGLDRGEFTLLFQPKIDLATETVTSAEALIRWMHPKRGFMPPDMFIPLAEQTGNIQKLTAWVLETAVRQVRTWMDKGFHIKVAVNLSAYDLSSRRLPDFVGQLLSDNGVPADQLGLEITESAVMEDTGRALEVLTALHEMGLILSIDDYGTGYSSLAYLKRLPVREIKIDKSFVMHLAGNAGDEILVRSTIELGHNLGLKVTAEGIEDSEAFAFLKQHGCERAQGYYISKPLSAADFEVFYATSRWSPLRNERPSAGAAAAAGE